MLKNRLNNDSQQPLENAIPAGEIANSDSVTASSSTSQLSSEFTMENAVPTNGSVQSIDANGMNNNFEEETEELSSSVVIEVTENPLDDELVALQHAVDLSPEDMETTLDDRAGSSSQDDGMISSVATSTSGSVVSVGQPIQLLPAPIQPAAAAVDQPEVTDFLDMDFEVEPTSTDEDEEQGRSASARKEKIAKRNHDFPAASCSDFENCQRRSDGLLNFSNGTGCESRNDCADFICDDAPSTSCSNGGASTIPKHGYSQSVPVSETQTCVHGCRACSSADVSGQYRLLASTSGATTILGDLPPASIPSASHASSAIPVSPEPHELVLVPDGARVFPLHSPRPRPRRFRAASTIQTVPSCPRLGLGWDRQQSVTVGGPDGLRLARSAYVGFPGQRGAGIGFSSSRPNFDGCSYRIWTIDEAEAMQATQIGPSMCGATALINVFKALCVDWKSNADYGPTEKSPKYVEKAVPTRQRANGAPVAEYLLSRSVAGTDAEDLISAASTSSDSQVAGRFFPMTETTIMTDWQEEEFARWLLHWLKRGAIPVLTLNMQRGLLPLEPLPDAWHHQMVFGVCTKTGGVYMTNPLECVPLWFLKHALCSPSVLLVTAEDVRGRWNGRLADLSPLLASSRAEQSTDPRAVPPVSWTEMNVIGQIARTLRQAGQTQNVNSSEPILTHISIPARYRSGVTLFARANSDVWTEISNAPGIDTALTLPPSHIPESVICDENMEEASSVVITVAEEDTNGQDDRDQNAEDDGEYSDLDETSNSDHGEHSQSCAMM